MTDELDDDTPLASLGPEWAKVDCQECDFKREATGTIASRDLIERAQKHANRMGHAVSVEHANAR